MKTFCGHGSPFLERPHFTDSEIDGMCEEALQKVGLLPAIAQPIRIERFIEKHFGVVPVYEDLPAGVLGFTTFCDKGVRSIHIPSGCTPIECDALLCPVAKDGYESRLYFDTKIECVYNRNWNAVDVRIGQRNWYAFSWRVVMPEASLQDLLIAHLNGFAKAA